MSIVKGKFMGAVVEVPQHAQAGLVGIELRVAVALVMHLRTPEVGLQQLGQVHRARATGRQREDEPHSLTSTICACSMYSGSGPKPS